MPKNPWVAWLFDASERTARTFIQGMLAVITVSPFTSQIDANWQTTLGIGAAAGAWAVVMSFAGKQVGSHDTASFLPEKIDPQAKSAKSDRRAR